MKALNKWRAECIFLNIEIRARGRDWSYSYVMTESRTAAKEVGQQWEKQQKRIRTQVVLAECKGQGVEPWAKGEFAEERKEDADGNDGQTTAMAELLSHGLSARRPSVSEDYMLA